NMMRLFQEATMREVELAASMKPDDLAAVKRY
ncbi:unnamed protein product, partial [marine sediment metagenome]